MLEQQLQKLGVEQAELEARELIALACGVTARNTAGWKTAEITQQQQNKAEQLLVRRQQGEPLAYVLGEWDFYGHTFDVTPDVLIPRGDTEWLCDAAVHAAQKRGKPRILDLCSGSGCIGISIALAVPKAQVTAIDCSDAALAVTRRNAARHDLAAPRFCVQKGDALAPDSLGEFDLVVSNPPYITQEEMQQLDPSVSEYEPHLALFGGTDGLDFYRAMAQQPPFRLSEGGEIFMECGWKQGEQVADLFRQTGWHDVHVRCDLSGVPRIVCAVWKHNKK